ncbi:putative germin-like protein 2-1 [Salvia miltiorrhiza]|uniref:putative germin-like protein 2-1 n=1 Tax=Salvia miltiorrhiza TaxID=226208 RepID=UPI0025AB8219|nr:putative germin-like protein 2-1 [Salvia miltiorrhiza]
MAKNIMLLCLVALSFGFLAYAFEPSPLQDFCVADTSSSARVNGHVCKNPGSVGAEDFSFSGLHMPGNTSNPNGSRVTPVTVAQLPGLNTLGISMVRIDYAPWGINPPHTHPRATEILAVIEGSLEVGFVTSNPDNRLITKTLQKGDVFVFPIGLVHFQRNVGTKNAVAIAALSSQNPGVITIANVVFGSKPDISSNVLAKAFQIEQSVVYHLQATF